VKTTRKVIVTYYPRDLDRSPQKYGITIEKSSSLWDFKVVMGEMINVVPESLVVLDVFCSRFHREFKSNEDVAEIKDNDDVAVYEVTYSSEDLPKLLRLKVQELGQFVEPTHIRLPIFVREEDLSSYSRSSIGVPFVVSVDKHITYRQLYNELINYMKKRRHIKQEDYDGIGDIFKIFIYTQSYTSNYYKSIHDNNEPLDLSDRTTLVCEFSKENRRKYYQEDIHQGVEVHHTASRNKIDATGSVSLYDCLKLFSGEEQLGENDAWYCTECKDFRQAFKKFDIWSAPQILVVQLKRFSQVNRIWRERLDNLIDFPLDNFDLTEFVIGPKAVPPIYDLFAVSNHFGSMAGGHYTAFARHRNDNKWYRYDDSTVTETSHSEIVSRAAYVLFYRRKDIPWTVYDESLVQVAGDSEESADSDDDSDDEDDKMNDVTEQAAGMALRTGGVVGPSSSE